MDIGGYPVVITDTAGIRKTENPVEKQGIEIAFKKIDEADIVIALYDAAAALNRTLDTYFLMKKKLFMLQIKWINFLNSKRIILCQKTFVAFC